MKAGRAPAASPTAPVHGLRLLVSVLLVVVGFASAQALSQVDADLRVMYQEYALAAVDVAHIAGDVIRYRATMILAVQAESRADFERLTANLPAERARIQHAVDRYAAASLRVSRSGRSEPRDLEAVRASLERYFSAASKTVTLLIQSWSARSREEAERLRREAELHAADDAGSKMIEVSLALDRLLETVTAVAQDMRDEGIRTARRTARFLAGGCLLLALLNAVAAFGVSPSTPSVEAPHRVQAGPPPIS